MVPTVGRDVHYVAHGTPGGEYAAGAHRAAKVTELSPYRGTNYTKKGTMEPSLMVINPTGVHFVFNVVEDPTGTIPGTWHWPERETES